MIFITTQEVDAILGSTWTTEENKADAVLKANTWLSAKRFCSGITPTIASDIKTAAAYLAKLSANGQLYVTTTDGVVTEKRVKADTVEVQKKYAEGQETGKSSDMQFIEDLLKNYLCGGVGAINAWVVK